MSRLFHKMPLLSVALGVAAAGLVGCSNKSAYSADDRLPAKKQETLMAADRMHNDGEDLKAQGVKLQKDGKEQEGAALIKQGEEKLMEAEKLKEKGMMMKE